MNSPETNDRRRTARDLYASVVLQARRAEFYLNCRVPDSVDGRFDMIALHAFLVLRRLKRDHERTANLAQDVFDIMFEDMENNLREMGAGDLGVSRRVKAMAMAFYGRITAYDAGLAGGDEVLADALLRNLYRQGECEDPKPMCRYMRIEAEALDTMDTERLLRGEIAFGPPPGGKRVET
jgi:cytochrome b pre-mRNA-processing protein 3